MSALALTSDHHLPERPDTLKLIVPTTVKRNLPGTNQSLVHAYHYFLTNPRPTQPAVNPLRHKVAMSLLTQMYTSPRWTAADTLYANLSSPRPRMVAPAPFYPLPHTAPPEADKGKDKKPPVNLHMASKTIMASETVIPLSAQPQSRIPEILRQVLSVSIFQKLRASVHLTMRFLARVVQQSNQTPASPIATFRDRAVHVWYWCPRALELEQLKCKCGCGEFRKKQGAREWPKRWFVERRYQSG